MVMVGPWSEIILSFISGIVGVLALAAGLQGYFFKRTNVWQRTALLIAAPLLIKPGLLTDLMGYALVVAVGVAQKYFGGRKEE